MNVVKMRLIKLTLSILPSTSSRLFRHFRLCAFAIAALFSAAANTAEPYVYNQGAGKTNYMLQCQGCHKANGEGIENSIPNMSDHGRKMLSTERGRQFFVAVPGSSQSPLSDQRLADVLNYIAIELLDSAANGNDFRYFDTSEITRYRRYEMKDVAQEREQIVIEIERQK